MFKNFVSYDLLLIIVNLIVYIKERERERILVISEFHFNTSILF